MTESLVITGAEGSPYSRKLRALLRFRRIPYRWVHQGSPEARDLPQPKVQLLPQLVMRDAAGALVAKTDTTPLVRELEVAFPERGVVPDDPALALIDALIEDYADEWLTKAMFHFRWAHADDVANASRLLPSWFRPDQPDDAIAREGDSFAERQVGRLAVVGSNDTTRPVIERSYERLLRALDAHLASSRFVLGTRPATCDFALYGQLTQLVRVDPTPARIAHATSLRVVAWVDLCEDLSGLELAARAWLAPEALPETLRALLAEAGRTHAPFLLANARALDAGADRVECTIDGRDWVQRPFPYQGKCLAWLRRDYEALDAPSRARFDRAIAGTGCEVLFGDVSRTRA